MKREQTQKSLSIFISRCCRICVPFELVNALSLVNDFCQHCTKEQFVLLAMVSGKAQVNVTHKIIFFFFFAFNCSNMDKTTIFGRPR